MNTRINLDGIEERVKGMTVRHFDLRGHEIYADNREWVNCLFGCCEGHNHDVFGEIELVATCKENDAEAFVSLANNARELIRLARIGEAVEAAKPIRLSRVKGFLRYVFST